MLSNSIKPIKLGVKFEPASIILIYEENDKLRSRHIPTKNLDFLTDIHRYAEQFKENSRYKKYFEKVTLNKVEKILFILQDNMRGYTLQESLSRAKKYDDSEKNSSNTSHDDNDENSEENLFSDKKKTLPKLDDYDDDDFNDSDDEDKNSKSVSTIEDVKAKKDSIRKKSIDDLVFEKPVNNKKLDNLNVKNTNPTISKTDALNLLSNQIKSVKSNIYDFEDEVAEEINDEDEHDMNSDEEDDDDDDERDAFNFGKEKTKKKADVQKLETAEHEDSTDSEF